MKYVDPLRLFHHMVKGKGQLLGLEVGTRYVGLAISDTDNKFAWPSNVLIRNKAAINLMADDLRHHISEFNLKGFVFSCIGQQKTHSKQVREFVAKLRCTGKLNGLQYTYWECHPPANENIYLQASNHLDPLKKEEVTVPLVAMLILKGYLDSMNQTEVRKDNSIFES